MIGLLNVLIAITILFFIVLILKEIILKPLNKNVCVLCASVVLTWVGLLILLYLGKFENKVLLALLIGESILGVFYTLESKVANRYKLFRLPFLLTLIVGGYYLLMDIPNLIKVVIYLLSLWAFFIIVYSYRTNEATKGFFNKLVECCKRW